jgi:tetratricopeptide (TPR) repeat protein/energy-coupling factor transporter ATP-binding protein EcfA2
MPLKSELLNFLSQLSQAHTSRQRDALLNVTDFGKLISYINLEGSNIVFFNELLNLLIDEGKNDLHCFLVNLAKNSNIVGSEDRSKLIGFTKTIDMLNVNDWNRGFKNNYKNKFTSNNQFYLWEQNTHYFTGCEKELDQLETLLMNSKDSKTCKLIGITGSNGVGKSTLVRRFAEIYKDNFSDGVIGFRVEGKDKSTIAHNFASKFLSFHGEKLSSEDNDEAVNLMQDIFAKYQMLLIFDNVEELTLKDMIPSESRCVVIVTTRKQNLPFSLGIEKEETIELLPFSESDSLELLKKIVGHSRIEESIIAAKRLVGLVGNLPLAINNLGSILRSSRVPLDEYVRDIEENPYELLEELDVADDPDRKYGFSLGLSLRHLDKNQVDFFACLSVCAADGFTKKTAMAATGLNEKLPAQRHLHKLHDLSLLRYVDTDEDRFVLLSLTRLYAEALARKRGLLTKAKERHAKYFITLLESVDLEDVKIIYDVAANLGDAILAAEWLQIHNTDTIQRKMESYQFILKLQPLFEQFGYWTKAIELMTKAQSWAEQFEDWSAVIKYKMHEARYYSFVEEFNRAEEILYSAKNQLHKIEDIDVRKNRESKLLNVFGGVFQKQNKIEEAIEAFRAEILVDTEMGNYQSLGMAWNRLGQLLLQSEDKIENAQQAFENAQQAFEKVINTIEVPKDKSYFALVLGNLAGILKQQGKTDEALKVIDQAIMFAETPKSQKSLATTLNGLAVLLQKQGKIEKAQEAFEKSASYFKYLENYNRAGIAFVTLGGLYQRQKKYNNALDTFLLATNIHESIESSALIKSLQNLSRIFYDENDLEKAFQSINAVIKICSNTSDLKLLAIANQRLGKIFQRQNKLAEAQQAFAKEIEISQRLNDLSQINQGLYYLANILHQQKKDDDYIIIEVSKHLNSQVYIAKTLYKLGKEWGSVQLLKRSQEIFEDEKEIQGQIKVLDALNDIFTIKNMWSDAEYILRQNYNLVVITGDKKKEAIIAKKLGQTVLNESKNEGIEIAQMYFLQSIKLGKELNDLKHRIDVYSVIGKLFLTHKIFGLAVRVLSEGFEIEENLFNIYGLRVVTPKLIYALSKSEKQKTALEYCERALRIAPNHTRFLQLHTETELMLSKNIQKTFMKIGLIAHIWYNRKDNFRMGKIIPDDGSSPIIFNEKFIGFESMLKLNQGVLVEAEVKEQKGILYAKKIRLIDEEKEYLMYENYT